MAIVELNIPYIYLSPNKIKAFKRAMGKYEKCRRDKDNFAAVIELEKLDAKLDREKYNHSDPKVIHALEGARKQINEITRTFAQDVERTKENYLFEAYRASSPNDAEVSLKEAAWIKKEKYLSTAALQALSAYYSEADAALTATINNPDANKNRIQLYLKMQALHRGALTCLHDPLTPTKDIKKLWQLVKVAGRNVDMLFDLKEVRVFNERQQQMHHAKQAGRFYDAPPERTFLINQFKRLSANRLADQFANEFAGLNNEHIKAERIGGGNVPVFKVSYTASSDRNKPDTTVVCRQVFATSQALEAREKLKTAGVDNHLSKQFYFAPLTYEDVKKGKIESYVEMSAFFKKGDLGSWVKNFSGTLPERQHISIQYMHNMVSMLSDFENNNVFFPDIKPSNFMIADNGQLVISDLKSFICHQGEPEIKSNLIVPSQPYLSPEDLAGTRNVFNRETMQAYLVGITLYEVATGDRVSEKPRLEGGLHDFDFSQPVFSGKKGEMLADILKGLTNSDPSKRLTIQEAMPLVQQLQEKETLSVESMNRLRP